MTMKRQDNTEPPKSRYEKELESMIKPEGMTDEQWSILKTSILKRIENDMRGCELTN